MAEVLFEILTKEFPSTDGSARYLETRRPARERGLRGWQLKVFGEVGVLVVDLKAWTSC